MDKKKIAESVKVNLAEEIKIINRWISDYEQIAKFKHPPQNKKQIPIDQQKDEEKRLFDPDTPEQDNQQIKDIVEKNQVD